MDRIEPPDVVDATNNTNASPTSSLEAIRREESQALLRLAAQRRDAEVKLAEAHQRVQDMLREAEAQGRCEGETQRDTVLAQVEHEAQAIIDRANAEAERLTQLGRLQMETAVARVLAIVIGGGDET
jgi:vacuolar-type H+-ATPase subunit H